MVSEARHDSCLHEIYGLMGKILNYNVPTWCCGIPQIGETGFFRRFLLEEVLLGLRSEDE